MQNLVQQYSLIIVKITILTYNYRIMNKILAILLTSLLCLEVQAQSFVCTDLNYYGSDLSPQKVQKEKAKYLGSKATLTFYDNSLKLSMTENGKIESIVLDKVSDNEYQYTEKNRLGDVKKAVIKLNKWAAYIRSFTLESYKNYSLEGSATFKRD